MGAGLLVWTDVLHLTGWEMDQSVWSWSRKQHCHCFQREEPTALRYLGKLPHGGEGAWVSTDPCEKVTFVPGLLMSLHL